MCILFDSILTDEVEPLTTDTTIGVMPTITEGGDGNVYVRRVVISKFDFPSPNPHNFPLSFQCCECDGRCIGDQFSTLSGPSGVFTYDWCFYECLNWENPPTNPPAECRFFTFEENDETFACHLLQTCVRLEECLDPTATTCQSGKFSFTLMNPS